MVGFNGLIQKLANRPILIYTCHWTWILVKAHELVGFEILERGYFLSVRCSNLNGLAHDISTRKRFCST